MACDAFDPIEEYHVSGSKQLEDTLPMFALQGLGQLATLKLPKDLKCIEDNSLIGLAIERIEIPSAVQLIGLNVFSYCKMLRRNVMTKENLDRRVLYVLC